MTHKRHARTCGTDVPLPTGRVAPGSSKSGVQSLLRLPLALLLGEQCAVSMAVAVLLSFNYQLDLLGVSCSQGNHLEHTMSKLHTVRRTRVIVRVSPCTRRLLVVALHGVLVGPLVVSLSYVTIIFKTTRVVTLAGKLYINQIMKLTHVLRKLMYEFLFWMSQN